MIRTYVKVKWTNLRRDKAALAITFGLPLAFLTIFVSIFGSLPIGGGEQEEEQRRVQVCILDEDDSELSRRFVEALGESEGLEVVTPPPSESTFAHSGEDTRNAVRLAVRRGEVAAALIVPAGWGAGIKSWNDLADASTAETSDDRGNHGLFGVPIELVYDPANPFARYGIQGSVQMAAMQAIPDVLMEGGFEWLDKIGGGLSGPERDVIKRLLEKVQATGFVDQSLKNDSASPKREPGGDEFSGFVRIEARSAREFGGDDFGKGKPHGTLTSYYAAGLGVMFLLFSVTGAGGTLLEEEQRGTLQRMLASDIRMPTILFGNWLFFASLGFIQVTLMFVWGAVVFGLDLWTINHFTGFLLMTVGTAAAAAAFGLVLASLCRTAAQLNGIGTIIVLIMSALGGSMVPRFVMPSFLDITSKFTFNGWALDGYLKIFWYDDPTDTCWQMIQGLLPEFSVLLATTFVFLAAARLLARRWEVI